MDTLIIFGAKYLFVFVLIGACLPLAGASPDRRKSYLLLAVVAGILALVLTKLAGRLYFDPRPFTHGITAMFPHDPDNGFPSDHTVLSVCAALLALTSSKRVGAVLLVMAIVVAICRVLSGIHNPIDVVAGAFIGMVSVAVAIGIIQAYSPVRHANKATTK